MSLIRKQVDTCAQKRLSIDYATHLVLGTGALGILSSQHNPPHLPVIELWNWRGKI